jgi:hypothetical protein
METLNRANINEHNKINEPGKVRDLIKPYETSPKDTPLYNLDDTAEARTKHLIWLLIDGNKANAIKYNITRHKIIRINYRILIIYRNNKKTDITNGDLITTLNNKYCMFYNDLAKLEYGDVLKKMYKKYNMDVYI